MCGRDCFYFTIFTVESQKKITIHTKKLHNRNPEKLFKHKIKNSIGILTRNRKYQLHEDRPYDTVKGYRRTFRSLFLQFTGSSPQFQEKLQKRIENRRVMRFEGIGAGIFLLSAV